jgi:hypothetical protein
MKPKVSQPAPSHIAFSPDLDADAIDIPSQRHQTADTGTSSSTIPVQTLIAEAIAEAQRIAREEYKKELEQQ